ncbi:MAG TPA: chromosome segregation protein SMC [Planctomycetes bacterium]|nr:chromosome segregation protein SMC [Planctomycetota bacterium]
MHLKRLELTGFKSFADKTVFHLDANVTCFVGPNGSGKSNVVDALRWALGEQSAKRLRGGEMQDVIFSGSAGRRASSFAEVTLVFDNHDRMLPVEYDEAAITRRLFASGESEYMINRQTCRLKDIKELFLGTGIGGGSYNIIEQGKVDALLQAGPLERRRVIEEVAGISGYKLRRDFAKNKLERLDASLETIRSVLAEVEKRLRSLARQVGKARRYREIREELTTLELDVSARRLAGMEDEFRDVTAALSKQKAEYGMLTGAAAEIEALEMDEARARAELLEQAQEAERLYRETVVAAERAKAAMAAAENTGISEQDRAERLRSEIPGIEARAAEARAALEDASARRSELAARIEVCRRASEEQGKSAEDALLAVRAAEEAVEEARRKAYETAAERAKAANRAQDCAGRAVSLIRRIEQDEEKAAAVNGRIRELEREWERCAEEKKRSEKAADALERVQERIRRRREAAERRERSRERHSARLDRAAAGYASRLELLKRMHAQREAFSEDVRSFVRRLEERGSAASLLGEMLTVPAEYRCAVEAVLDEFLGTVVLDDFTQDALDGMTERRINLYPAAARGESGTPLTLGAEDKGVTAALDVVECPASVRPLVEDLLAATVIVDGTPDVNEFRARHPRSTLVTLNGEILHSCGLLSIRRGEALPGVIGRGDEIAAAADAMARAAGRSRWKGRATKTGRLEALGARADAARSGAAKHGEKLGVAAAELGRLRRERELIFLETTRAKEEAEELEAAAMSEAEKASRLVAEEAEVSAALGGLVEALAQRRYAAEDNRRRAGEQVTALARHEEQLRALDAEAAALQRSLAETAATAERMKNEAELSEQRAKDASESAARHRVETAELIAAADAHQKEAARLSAERSRLDAAREERSAERRTLEKQISAIRDEMEALRLRENSLTHTRTSLIEDVLERYGRDLGEAAANIERPAAAPTPEEEQRVAELKRQLNSLGAVNLTAIEEEDELRERRDFLKKEITDLETARTRLFEAIERLDGFCRERFTDALERVSKNFQELFRKLFQGGDVKLRLLEGDVLEAGLEITVRPPGKEPRVLSLLSGGEKAMTAIALIMAAFKASPSPFCFLDEVDGPLDEANVERLNLIIEEFAAGTQFIIITHNKVTMSHADTLYGIAMEEPGVSMFIKTDIVRAAENLAVAD